MAKQLTLPQGLHVAAPHRAIVGLAFLFALILGSTIFPAGKVPADMAWRGNAGSLSAIN